VPHLNRSQAGQYSVYLLWQMLKGWIDLGVGHISPYSITKTLRLSPKLFRGESRGHKSWKFATQITSSTFIICVADFCDFCSWQSRRQCLRTLSPTFPVHCNGLNSIRATQTGLSWTLSRTLLQTPRHVKVVCVGDFLDLCSRLSPQGSFVESQRNGIWAIPSWVTCLQTCYRF